MSDKPIPEKTITEKKMLNINIEYSQLDKFCRQLITRSRDIAKTHDALITLETFITNFGRSQQGSESYNAVESLIKTFTEQTRQTLLEQKTTELLHALYKQDIDAIAAIHTPLSRNGFYLILQAAAAQFTPDEMLATKYWVSEWTQQTKQKADQLSQYPDAPDFKAAGITLKDYLAMADVNRYLDSI